MMSDPGGRRIWRCDLAHAVVVVSRVNVATRTSWRAISQAPGLVDPFPFLRRAFPIGALATCTSAGDPGLPGQPDVLAEPALPSLDRYLHRREEYTIGADESMVLCLQP